VAVTANRVAKRTDVPEGVSRTDDAGVRPMPPDAQYQPPQMGANLLAVRGFARPQDG
jgi:hypothetical protein